MVQPNAAPEPDSEEPLNREAAAGATEGEQTVDASNLADPAATDGTDLDVDDLFFKITADLDDVSAAGAQHEERLRAIFREPPAVPGLRSLGPRDHPTTAEVWELEDEQSHFTPPEPENVLSSDPLTNLAWFAAVTGPFLLLLLVVFFRPVPAWLAWSAIGLTVSGIIILLYRMPHSDEAA